MNPRIPELIYLLLDAFQARLDARLPGYLTGLYLQGSIALGAFNERSSDIDFVALASRDASVDDVRALREVHRAVEREFPRWPLEGSYLQAGDLGKSPETIAPHPHYHDRRLDPASRGDVNPVTWWLLKHKGIALRGPEPAGLDFDPPWDAVVAYMRDNINTYWAHWPDRPVRRGWLLLDGGVVWVVLGVLRQYTSFREGDIVSKTAAGEYALGHLPEEWHGIVREAIRCREGGGPSLYRSRLARAGETLRFLRYVIAVCNQGPEH